MTDSVRVELAATKHLIRTGDTAKSANDSLDEKGVQKLWKGSKRVYVTRTNLEALRSRLSARQWTILSDVSRLGVASGGQLQRLHYSPSQAAKRQARQDLAELVRWQVLSRLKRNIGGERAGSKGYIYAMGIAGQRLVDPGRRRYRQPWTPGVSYLSHALAVSELYVALREIASTSDVALAGFDTEPGCWRSFSGPGGGQSILKPDAMAVLYIGDFEDRYFVEMDCGTEPGSRITAKAKTYIHYLKSGREQARTDVFPYVLWVTPDDRRAEFLIDVLSSLPADDWSPFRVTTAAQAARLIATARIKQLTQRR